ncbi:MAG: hypothetical protein ABJC12_04730 [Saprospiraceae bacterium]
MKYLPLPFIIIFSFFTCVVFSQKAAIIPHNNPDFVPGKKIIFEDRFKNSRSGEFPDGWNLISGKGVVNKFQGANVFLLTDGNYAKVAPHFKDDIILPDTFTIEFDFNLMDGAFPLAVFFPNENGTNRLFLWGPDVETGYITSHLTGKNPEGSDHFYNKWHHAALSCESGQIKCYIDQYKVLVIPNCGFAPTKVLFGGVASPEIPLAFTNVRIASGVKSEEQK